MPALYSHTTRAIGTTLTASIYNADHQNHITNGIPLQLDDYSSTVVEMQTNTDPGELGAESQAGSLAGELERLRFAIKEVKQVLDANITQWYQTPEALTATPRLPRWYIDGLELNVSATSVSYIRVSPGTCRDAADTINMNVSSGLHRSASALWVTAATGGGMGVTWVKTQSVHVFVVKTGASVFDIGFDRVLTASNLLARASGTKYRRIGSLVCATKGGELRPIEQRGDYLGFVGGTNGIFNATYIGGPLAAGGISDGGVAIPGVPTGIFLEIRLHAWATESARYMFYDDFTLYSPGTPSNAPNPFLFGGGASNTVPQERMVWCNYDADVRYRINPGFTVGPRYVAFGYRDLRR